MLRKFHKILANEYTEETQQATVDCYGFVS